jgi:IPTL-CTERM motif
MSRRTRIAAILASLTALFSLPAFSQQLLYGAIGASATTSNLLIIDTATGATTSVGPIGQALTGMAYNGTMYGVTNGNSACSRCLISINLTTGAGTVIGPVGLTISELEFGANGTLYGWSESNDVLASINTTTGAGTEIPGSGLSTSGDGMALVGGVMYVMPEGDSGTYYIVNTTTGATTLAGTLTNAPFPGTNVSAAAVDPGSGVVYAAYQNFGVAPSNLVTVNMATGVATNVGSTALMLDALAFAPAAGAASGPVPTLSEWALLIMALLIGATAVVTLRKRF